MSLHLFLHFDHHFSMFQKTKASQVLETVPKGELRIPLASAEFVKLEFLTSMPFKQLPNKQLFQRC